MSGAGDTGCARAEIVRAIVEAAPPGSPVSDRSRLVELTHALVRACPEGATEFDRYLAVMRREISLPRDRLSERIRGRTVLVTGSSGCIGTALLAQLVSLEPARIVGVDIAPPRSPVPIAYRCVDVC